MKQNIIITEHQFKKLITESLDDLKNKLNEPNSNNINDITLFKVFNEDQISEAEDFLKYKVRKYESYYFPIVIIKVDANLTYPIDNSDQYNSEDVSIFIPFMYRYKSTIYPDTISKNIKRNLVKGSTQTSDYGFIAPAHLVVRISKNNIDYDTKLNFYEKITGDVNTISKNLNDLIFKEENTTHEQEIKNKIDSLLSPHKPDNLKSTLSAKRTNRFQ